MISTYGNVAESFFKQTLPSLHSKVSGSVNWLRSED